MDIAIYVMQTHSRAANAVPVVCVKQVVLFGIIRIRVIWSSNTQYAAHIKYILLYILYILLYIVLSVLDSNIITITTQSYIYRPARTS